MAKTWVAYAGAIESVNGRGHIRSMVQLNLLGPDDCAGLPEGVRYVSNVLTTAEEQAAAAAIEALELKPFAFHGFRGNRRTASFGWHYDFQGGGLQKAAPIPEGLLPYREVAASLAGIPPESLEHLLAIEYSPGVGIGWHRDKPQFGVVAALSLLAPCRIRFRKKTATGWVRLSRELAPRSGYMLDGPGRTEWEHSIPPVDVLRYSLTFRTLKAANPVGRRPAVT
jgi:alkylated DNA repair dioxygenase AlkB